MAPGPRSENSEAKETATDSTPTDSPPKKRRKGAPPTSLHVFHVREEKEDGTAITLPNTEFWVWSRTPHNDRKRGGNAKRGKPRGPRTNMGGKTRGGKPAQQRAKETRKIEDSPFAALKDLYKKD
jgi:hypothetical protein